MGKKQAAKHLIELSEDGSEYIIRIPRKEFDKIDLSGAPKVSHLSPRQEEVLKMILNGKVNKEIAEALHITVRTVKFHTSSLLRKYQLRDRMALFASLALGASPTQVIRRDESGMVQ